MAVAGTPVPAGDGDGDRIAAELLAAAAAPARTDRRHLYLTGASLVALLVVWHLLPTTGLVSRRVLATPVETVEGLQAIFESGFLLEHLLATVIGIVAGFAIGGGVGFLLGVALAISTFLRRTFSFYIYALQALPKVVLAPLFIAWLGFGSSSKIATAAAICFFPILVNTSVGIMSAGRDQVALMRSLGASRWQTLVKLQLPAALPLIFVGIKNSLVLAFTGTLIAEILVGGGDGLGTLVQLYNRQLQMPLVFAIVVIVAVIALLLVLVFERIDRKVVFWRNAA